MDKEEEAEGDKEEEAEGHKEEVRVDKEEVRVGGGAGEP